MTGSGAAAVAAAVTVARKHGLPGDDPLLLPARHSTLVVLRPAPVVARVSAAAALVRDRLAAGLALAAYAAPRGAPVVPPASGVDPGPHRVDGLAVTFWKYVAAEGKMDARAAGRALRELHAAIADAPIQLPCFDPRADALRIAERLDADDAAVLRAAARAVAVPASPSRPLHGDAHLGNVIQTRAGPLWADLEEPCAGPVEWDLALLSHRAHVWSEGDDAIGAALAGYGAYDRALVEELAGPVGLWLAALTCLGVAAAPAARGRADARLAWLKRRYAL